MNFLGEQSWIIIGLVFFGIIFAISWLRWKDRKWIENRFGTQRVKAVSFGVNYFGRVLDPRGLGRSSGFLILLADGLFFRSRFKRVELNIPGENIRRVYHDRKHKGIDLHQSVVKIDFTNSSNEVDTVAFRLPYPPQWIEAIKNNFLRDTEATA